MGRARDKRGKIEGRFLPLRHTVLRSREFLGLSGDAVKLLLLIGLQHNGKNNGKLVATPKYLAPLGWRSHWRTTKCLRELKASGLLHETRMGGRPNRAAWFAIAWLDLDVADGLDARPSAFKKFVGTPLIPIAGIANNRIVPAAGIRDAPVIPPTGTVKPVTASPLSRHPGSI